MERNGPVADYYRKFETAPSGPPKLLNDLVFSHIDRVLKATEQFEDLFLVILYRGLKNIFPNFGGLQNPSEKCPFFAKVFLASVLKIGWDFLSAKLKSETEIQQQKKKSKSVRKSVHFKEATWLFFWPIQPRDHLDKQLSFSASWCTLGIEVENAKWIRQQKC